MLPWAYCVIIDLSHYANVEKQLVCVCVCVRVCEAVVRRACVWMPELPASASSTAETRAASERIELVRREPLAANTRN